MRQQNRKTRVGEIVSNKTSKTVVVAVEWRQRHPLYQKSVRRIAKFHAHDEENACRMGDLVRIMETRPLSKTKRWRVVEVLRHREMPQIKPSEIDTALVEAAVAPKAAGPGQEPGDPPPSDSREVPQEPPQAEGEGEVQS